VRLGLIPATIGPYVIARMGAARARAVFFSGRVFGAEEAVGLGLLARVVGAEDLDAAVEAEVAPYLAAAPGAVAAGKRLVAELSAPVDEAQVARSIEALVGAGRMRKARGHRGVLREAEAGVAGVTGGSMVGRCKCGEGRQ
jgi:methylglutaconyl-CoA hydratase